MPLSYIFKNSFLYSVFSSCGKSFEKLCAISIGFSIGPKTCSSKFFALPSQNCLKLKTAFNTVGAFISPTKWLTPREEIRLSSPPSSRLWQLAHEIVLSEDNRLSLKSFFPKSALFKS